jgi:oligo-1,6-glucosidase
MLLTLKGTPFIYQGDELAMTNYPFTKIEDFNDIEVKNAWKGEVLTHQVTAEDYIASLRKTSRDNSRTPMQWDDSANGGFTTAPKAWLAVNPNSNEINAKQAVADPDSVYHYFQKLIALRKKTPALVYGDYKDLDPQHPSVFAYTRTLGALRYLVVLNLSSQAVTYLVPPGQKVGSVILSNLPGKESATSVLRLRPWDARIYRF